MCGDLYTLKLSNRGTNVRTLVANQKYAVTLPNELHSRGACEITVVAGTLQTLTDNTVFHTYSEIACKTNIPQRGYDSEGTLNGWNMMQKLFDVDLSSYHTNNVLEPFRLNNPKMFYCGSLPSQIEFERVVVIDGNTAVLAGDWYISFELQIRFLE